MSTSPNPAPAVRSAPAEARPHPDAARPSSFAAVPGWVLSGMLHAAVIVFLVTSGIPSCGDQQIGTGADHGNFREVGIYIKEPNTPTERPKDPQDDQPKKDNRSPSKSASAAPSKKNIDETVSDLIDVPDVQNRSVIGQSAAAPPPGGVPSESEATVTANSVYTPPAKGQGPGNVSFMGQTTPAKRVVYLIDTSSSMNSYEAIEYAKVKLKQSINGLTQQQLFQIISYADFPSPMRFKQESKDSVPLYRANGINLRLANRHINSITAVGGTQHMRALEQALTLKPDVLFFLTDASQEAVSPRDMERIQKVLNKDGKTHIYCFKFGRGPDLKSRSENFLRKLASENRGTYTYMDIEKLESP